MAYTNGLSDRMGQLRNPNDLRSPTEESPYSTFASPPRGQNVFYMPMQQPQASNETRANLTRRFTTDASKMPGAVGQLGYQTAQVARPDYANSQERKRQQIEEIREQKRKFMEQMRVLDEQEQGLQGAGNMQDQNRSTNRYNRLSLNAGPVSEPTTPPEYSNGAYANSFTRNNRYSMNSVFSPPGLGARYSQPVSQITSPPNGRHSMNSTYLQNNRLSAKSMPGSRRGSDEDEYFPQEMTPQRHQTSSNRFSMPANSNRTVNHRLNMASAMQSAGPPHVNTTSFLFGDEDDTNSIPAARAQALLQMTGGLDDKFPTLRSDLGGTLSANSAALDLAKSSTPDSESWASFAKSRPSHQSMPQEINMFRPVLNSPPSEAPVELTGKKSQRHSMGVSFSGLDGDTFDQSPTVPSVSRPGAIPSSYSTNDLPTMKSTNSIGSALTNSKTTAEQQFHNHNASLGRIPARAVNNRHSRDIVTLMNGMDIRRDDQPTLQTHQSNLQGSAAPFGPTYSSPENSTTSLMAGASHTNGNALYQYSMDNFNISAMGTNGQPQGFVQSQNLYGQYGGYNQYNKQQDTHTRGGRRGQTDESRFQNIQLEQIQGQVYDYCKDQHGCRFLQRKLEEQTPEHTQMIFQETLPHINELMTDPFGNYLCQKLFEFCNDEQRSALITAAASGLVDIALNQHGTRALQKMIEFVNTQEQVQTIIHALSTRVVELVQDLNGNHVIQKCLNRLGAENSQFIYDAVGTHCVIVGTHRHGCCVLQRCVDHATGFQRAQLIARITQNAFNLVQDPFGNYVVQYILDLDEPQFTQPLCISFCNNIPALSKQKFSSNVIEKCLRTADNDTKKLMIEEMLRGAELEKMLRDSFANYVVQTAMDHADAETKQRIIDAIRPILPLIKQTPHGRRIASKITGLDGQGRITGTSSGSMTPSDVTSPSSQFSSGRNGPTGSGRRQFQIYGSEFIGNSGSGSRYTNNFATNKNNVNNYSNTYSDYTNVNNGLSSSTNAMFTPVPPIDAPAANSFMSFNNQTYNNNQNGANYF